MARFIGNAVGDAFETLYKASFGDLPHGSVVYEPGRIEYKTVEGGLREVLKENLEKVATSGTIPAVPVMVDSEIVRRVHTETPVLSLIKRRAHKGATVKYNVITDLGDRADFLSESEAVNGTFPDATGTYSEVTETIKISVATGGVSGFAQAADAHYIDLYREEVENATLALKLLHEKAVIQGDSSADANSYDGLIKRVPSDNIEDKAGAALTMEDVIDAINTSREVAESGRLAIITDYATHAKIVKLAMEKVSYVNPTQLDYGLRTVEVMGVPIVPSRYVPESDTTNHYHQFLVANLDYIEFRVLQEPMLVETAVTADARKFFIKEYSTLIHKYPDTMVLVKNFAL